MNSLFTQDTPIANHVILSDDDRAAWVRLSRCDLPPIKLNAALAQFDDDPIALIAGGQVAWRLAGFGPSQCRRLLEQSKGDVGHDLETLDKREIKLILRSDSCYPPRLRPLEDSPPLLYCRGELEYDDQFSIAIVGSRRATSYGLSIAERFARELTASALTIVSGGARGVDTYAHRGALSGRGRTIAVIGCGLDRCYPVENRHLYQEMAAPGRGAVISEYALGSTPDPWRFPARNRLIAGIALGTLVIESPLDSGAMITATDAANYGREVFAVPGPIETGLSAGAHKLIKEGAKLAECADDILDEIGVLRLSDEPARAPLLAPAENLSPEQRKVVDLLSLQAQNLDQLAAQTAFPPATLVGILTMLELRGYARRVPGNAFVRVL